MSDKIWNDSCASYNSAEKVIIERLEYWRNKDLRNGWTRSSSGPCCDKCRMTNPKDPLQSLVACRDPFQMNCDCHIPTREGVRNYIVQELEAILRVIEMIE